MNELGSPKGGSKHFLLGNEAIVRGALEAGVHFVAAYPGTPSSEIIDTFYRIGGELGVEVEYSVNEKVSVETASAVAAAGGRSLCCMKHVGLNVAADAFMTLAYVGVKGGMVVVSADDPSLHSSQNEQDNRYYAKMAHVPMLEPATPEEAKVMTSVAFDLSERYHIPFLLRTTTRVNHCRGVVEFGDLPPYRNAPSFEKDPMNLVVVPMVGRKLRVALLEKERKLQRVSETSPFNHETGDGQLGVICSGVAYLYVVDAIRELGLREKVRILKLGMTNPLPREKIAAFLGKVEKALVVEELDPYVEEQVLAIAAEYGVQAAVLGKRQGLLPQAFELDAALVKKAVSRAFEVSYIPLNPIELPANLPPRPPNLCPGCPHRATYYSVKKVFGEEALYPTDIGCYTLGLLPPLKAADFLICMGSSVTTAGGFSAVIPKPVVAFIGDSTFFHSGIPGLINAVTHDRRLLLVVLDNGTTAMTGHQPHPGVEIGPGGRRPPKVSIESVVKGCGVSKVITVNPLNVGKTQQALEEMRSYLEDDGKTAVLIAKSPCPLFERRMLQKKKKVIFQVGDECDLCRRCLNELGCPAFVWEREDGRSDRIRIDETMCNGCAVCSQLCDAIKAKRVGE